MIWLITFIDENSKVERVSHGIDGDTDRIVILPENPVGYFGAIWSESAGMWFIKD
jgi:hypothetical protein